MALPLFFLVAAAAAPDCRAESGVRTDIRVLPAYFTGDYGTGIDTSIVYVPLILAVSSARQEFRLTVPYLSINTSEPVIYLDGEVIGPVPGGSTSESGLGDVFAQEEVFFVQGTARRPWLSGILRIKFPTADETRGLGSGELDYGGGLGIIQPLGPAWSLIGALQYVVRGDPAGVDFRNTAWVTIGTQWRPSKKNAWNAFYDRRQSVIEGNTDLADLSLGYDRLLSAGISFRSTVYIGLSDTTEDFGFSAGFSFTPVKR
jgi:outer membrane putative beta-barrel porin/alpha-amylase